MLRRVARPSLAAMLTTPRRALLLPRMEALPWVVVPYAASDFSASSSTLIRSSSILCRRAEALPRVVASADNLNDVSLPDLLLCRHGPEALPRLVVASAANNFSAFTSTLIRSNSILCRPGVEVLPRVVVASADNLNIVSPPDLLCRHGLEALPRLVVASAASNFSASSSTLIRSSSIFCRRAEALPRVVASADNLNFNVVSPPDLLLCRHGPEALSRLVVASRPGAEALPRVVASAATLNLVRLPDLLLCHHGAPRTSSAAAALLPGAARFSSPTAAAGLLPGAARFSSPTAAAGLLPGAARFSSPTAAARLLPTATRFSSPSAVAGFSSQPATALALLPRLPLARMFCTGPRRHEKPRVPEEVATVLKSIKALFDKQKDQLADLKYRSRRDIVLQTMGIVILTALFVLSAGGWIAYRLLGPMVKDFMDRQLPDKIHSIVESYKFWKVAYWWPEKKTEERNEVEKANEWPCIFAFWHKRKPKINMEFKTYSGNGFKLLIPSKWNPSQEREYPGQVLRYDDKFDANSNICVIITATEKKTIADYGTPEEFLSKVDNILAKAEGRSGEVATATIVQESSAIVIDGKKYYTISVLTRTAADGDEGGKHQLISATVAAGNIYLCKARAGDKRWFKGARKDVDKAVSSFTVA